MPVLQNVMSNYMECSQILITDRFAVTYTTNQNYFDIFARKYMNDLRVRLSNTNFEGQKALEITSSNLILVSLTNYI